MRKKHSLPFVVIAITIAAGLLLQGCAGAPSAAGVPAPVKQEPAPGTLESSTVTPEREDLVKLGDASFSTGDYVKALELYSKALDRPRLEKVASALLAAGDYERYVIARQQAAKRIVVSEEFRDNSRKWNLRNDDSLKAAISGGKLVLERLKDKGTSYIWTTGSLDANLDFKIEAVITKKSGMDNNAISVAWGIKNADNNDQFGFSGDGHYNYGRTEGGKWQPRIEWTASQAINKGNSTNKITVVRNAGTLLFFLNDQQVDTAKFLGFFGDRVGISMSTKVTIEMESFLVEEYPSARGPWEEIADSALAAFDFSSAMKYSSRAGNSQKYKAAALKGVEEGRLEVVRQALKDAGLTEKAAEIRLASLLQSLGKSAEAVTELAKAGWDIKKGFVYPLLRESFEDNSRGWATGTRKTAKMDVKDGKYLFEKLDESGSYSTWNYCDLSPDADYRIETAMKKVSGADNETYSVIWGFDAPDQRQDFGVMGSGSLEYGFFTDGKWKDVIAPTPSAKVRKGNDSNVLTVVRRGDMLTLSVNGTQAGQAPARELVGAQIGFSLSPKMAAEIDRLDVTEYAPAFVLELARASLFASNPREYSRLAAAMYLDQSEYQKALDELLAIGDQKGAQPCYEGLAEQAAAAGETGKAVEYYLKAGSGQQVLEGLAAGYTVLGKTTEAENANAKLADWYLRNGKPAEALATFLKLSQPAQLSAAGERYFKAGDYDSAAALFERAGDATALKRTRSRIADRLAADGDYGAALELYRLAGNSPKAEAIEKKLKALGVGAQRPEVAMCSESSGTGVSLSMIFDLSGSNLLGAKPSTIVILPQPSTDLAGAFSYFFSDGDFCVVLDSGSDEIKDYTTYGSYHYYKDEVFWGPTFTRKGAGELQFGNDYNGKIWRVSESGKDQIGEKSFQEYVDPSGEKRTGPMTRLKSGSQKWLTNMGDKLMQLESTGTLTQIAWVAWRKIVTPEGKPLAIIMSKAMTKDAKWAGRYDGKLYQDK